MKKTTKNYNSTLYISDNYLILKIGNNYYETQVSKSIIKHGYIIHKDKFINFYKSFLKKNHLSRFLWNKKILIIYSENYSINDKLVLKNIFYELGYQKVDTINEISTININKNDCYLIGSYEPKLYYLNDYNEKYSLSLGSFLSDKEKASLIKNRCHNKNLFIIKENSNLIKFIESLNLNYYYFEGKEPIFLKKF